MIPPSSPVPLSHRPLARLAALLATLGLLLAGVTAVPASAATNEELHESFNRDGAVNSALWQLTLGTQYEGGPPAFGTWEEETNTADPANVRVEGGSLVITPTKRDGRWYSARVESRKAYKPAAGQVMTVTYDATLPDVHGAAARGYWPALWSLSEGCRQNRWGWPTCGESDLMESVNGNRWVAQTLHCGIVYADCTETSGIGTGLRPLPGGESPWGTRHRYGWTWDRSGPVEKMSYSVDGVHTRTVTAADLKGHNEAAWAALTRHGYNLIMNVAISGVFPVEFGGNADARTQPGHPMRVHSVDVSFTGGGAPEPKPEPKPDPKPEPKPDPKPELPAGQLDLRVASVTPTSITLKWNPRPGATYRIARAGIPLGFPAATSGGSLTDVGLRPGLDYIEGVEETIGGKSRVVTLGPVKTPLQ